jgi:hypothetical protein
MNLVDLLTIKYPSTVFGPNGNVQIADEGNGQFILMWGLQDPKPTQQDIDAWMQEFAQAYADQQKIVNDAPLLAQLREIHINAIGALLEQNTDQIAEFASQATAVKAQLSDATLATISPAIIETPPSLKVS